METKNKIIFQQFTIETNKTLIDFANYAKLSGWYFDANGCYCCICRNKVFCVFINNCDNSMDISVHFIGNNIDIEWETHNDFNEMLKAIQRLLSKYAFD